MTKTQEIIFQGEPQCFEHLEIRVLNLFAAHALRTVRISDFEFRILYMAKHFLPEKTGISQLTD